MDKTQEMASFVAVVKAGSFVGAADALGLSKAAVSRQVGELEQRLGARLLHRTPRRLSLTDDGQVFSARAKELLAAIEEAESEITSRSGEASGVLRINAPLTFGVLHLAPLWGRFADMHPEVTLEVDLSARSSTSSRKALTWRCASPTCPAHSWSAGSWRPRACACAHRRNNSRATACPDTRG